MRFDYRGNYREPQARPSRLARTGLVSAREPLEGLGAQCRWEARAFVRNREDGFVAFAGYAHPCGGARGGVNTRVLDQVVENLAEAARGAPPTTTVASLSS